MDTLVVNLFGGPGASKSTNCALVFGKLKCKGINAEIASEYAKDLVWEDRTTALNFQPYIIGKQTYKVHRLLGQVEVVLTDSPILFGLIYGQNNLKSWESYIVDQFKSWRTLNIHLVRNVDYHPYNPKGRLQTLDEAQKIDKKIEMLLDEFSIPHLIVEVAEGEQTAELITEYVVHELKSGVVFT